MNRQIFGTIRRMLMKKKVLTCLYNYEPKVEVVVERTPSRNAILKGVSWKNFVNHLLATSYNKRSQSRERDFEDCLEDCVEKGYIYEGLLWPGGSDPNAPTPPLNATINYIVISSDGRKLAKGWWVTRWLYFIELLFREHWLLYTVIAFIFGLILRNPTGTYDWIVSLLSR